MKKQLDLIITGGEVFLPNSSIEKIDIGIKDSKIVELGDLSKKDCEKKIVVNNLIVLPGAIDSQVHFREPGLTHKEDIMNGTKGAILGGVTSIFEMPNTNPSTTTEAALNEKISIAQKNAYCNYSFFVGAAKENIENLKKLERLPGCCGVKIFMGSSTGDLLVEDDDSLRKILASGNRRVAIHSEDEYRLRERKHLVEDSKVGVSSHPLWRDSQTAIRSTQRLLKIAQETKRKIHVLHISTGDEILILKKFKNFSTCEVTPQHLFFYAPDCYENLGSLAQMNPPIRDKSHNIGLWKGIEEKIVDVIGSDHAPHTLEEKKKEYPNCPSGMTGVQTILPIMLDFVNKGKLGINDLVRLLCYNPAKIYNMKSKGEIKIGNDADFSIVDLNKEFTITNEWIASKSGWTPYNGLKITGLPVFTVVNGKIVMQDSEIISPPIGEPVLFNYD
ncbi:dihydroorotase [Alphaproteobacteria bacterium]|nr:dihydroorotase [Alphaproteobacteria bacterium]|tara:strand:- start:1000 stop:2334 length:1335 start_codon:yes stop_codon:yes gene_type:complete